MARDSDKSQTGPPKAVSFGANGQINGDNSDQDAQALRRSSTGVQGCAIATRLTYQAPGLERQVAKIQTAIGHGGSARSTQSCERLSFNTQPPCRLKHRTFSSNDLRDCDFSERKDDALKLHRTIEVEFHMTLASKVVQVRHDTAMAEV